MVKDMFNQFISTDPVLKQKLTLKYGSAYDFYSKENKATMTVLITDRYLLTKNRLIDLIDRDIIKISALTFSDGFRVRE